MKYFNCEECSEMIKFKCSKCNKLKCDSHMMGTCTDNKPHKKVQAQFNKMKIEDLFEMIRNKLLDHLRNLEIQYSNILMNLITLKNDNCNKIYEYLNRLDNIKLEILEGSYIGTNPNSLINNYLYFNDESINLNVNRLLIYEENLDENFREINDKIKTISIIDFKIEDFLTSEKVQEKITSSKSDQDPANQNTLKTFEKINTLRSKLINNPDLGLLIPITKIEQFRYRESIKSYIFTKDDCKKKDSIYTVNIMLTLFPNLIELTLENLSSTKCCEIFSGLKELKSLKILNIERCMELQSEEYTMLQKNIRNLKLAKLSIISCNCLEVGISRLVNEINVSELKELWIPSNIFGYAGAASLALKLASFANLEVLNLRNNDLSKNEIDILSTSMGKLVNLKYFDVSFNRLGAAGIVSLLSLANRLFLVHLDISSNGLAECDEEKYTEIFDKHFTNLNTLQTLVIDMTFTKRSIAVLRSHLKKFTVIFVSNSAEIAPLPKHLR